METTDKGGGMKVAVCGPNLGGGAQKKGEFHVHAAGCGDLKHYGSGKYGGEKPYVQEAADKTDIVYAVYDCQIEEGSSYESCAAEFWYAPCCAGLQEGTPDEGDTAEGQAKKQAAWEAEQAAKKEG